VAAAGAADEAGGLLALLTLATAGVALPLGRLADTVSRPGLMAGGALLGAAGIAVLSLPAGLSGLVVGGLLMAIGTSAFVTANWAATTAIVPAAESGRLLGLANLGTGLAAAAAGLLGFVVDAAGFGPALGLAAVLTASAVLPIVGAKPGLRAARESLP
jgi:MFS family permease